MPPVKSAEFPVFDTRYGRQIGTVRSVRLGRNRREFWHATSLDGVDLGAHVQRDDAHYAIQDDWDAGRPRDPRNPHERWRPLADPGSKPIYLGR